MNPEAYKEYRKMQIENQGPVTQEVIDAINNSRKPDNVSSETWEKMDKFDREWFHENQKNGFLPEEEKKKVGWSIYDHEADGNWDVSEVLRSFLYGKPTCEKCGKSDSMVKHSNGEWVCHHTHKI